MGLVRLDKVKLRHSLSSALPMRSDPVRAVKPGTSWYRLLRWLLGVPLFAACLSGCNEQPAAAPAPPPPSAGVLTVKLAPVTLTTDLPGRLEAVRSAQVRARVAGVVQRRLFTEGTDVRAGELLFQIDPAPYQAAVDRARADLIRAQANLAQARANLARNRPLADAQALSQQELLASQTLASQAEADLLAARAALRAAEIDLGHASVRAPLSGRIGRALVTEGALVGQGEATPLAVIQQVDRLYVNFSQPAADAMRLRAASGSRVQVVLDDGSIVSQDAKLLFADLTVDAGSAQVGLRAELPNPKGMLLPGLYVRVRIQTQVIEGAVTIPQQAVVRGPSADSVFVVDAQDVVQLRAVRLGPAQGNQWVVLKGLRDGERVVVDGFQKIKPQTAVRPVPWSGVSSGASPSASPGAASASGAMTAVGAGR